MGQNEMHQNKFKDALTPEFLLLCKKSQSTKKTEMKKYAIFNDFRNLLKSNVPDIAKKKKQLTPEFNLLEIISPKEIQISRVIGDFLNPKGHHGQGDIFLQYFIEKFIGDKRKFLKGKTVSVSLEYSNNVKGQIDIVLDFDKTFGIGIENKPFATDQDEQISRYIAFFKNNYGNDNFTMIYISSSGNNPSEKSLSSELRKELAERFIVISYSQIKDWLIQCTESAKKNEAKRLVILINEIIEYINLTFLNMNSIKNNLFSGAIKNNILDAFEIVNLWKKNGSDFKKLWAQEINRLFNRDLPELVFDELIHRNVIDENWEIIPGDFDILKNAVRGFKIKKKNWSHFQYAVLSSRIKTPNGTRDFFPAIMSKEKPLNEKYFSEYAKETGGIEPKEQTWSIPPIIWWTNFDGIWGYDHWTEIKPNGATVNYVANFFEKLIAVSEKDIDMTEKTLQSN